MSFPEPYSYRIYPSTKELDFVQVPFEFINRADVHVYQGLNEISQDSYDWVTDGEIKLPKGTKGPVTVRRITWEDDRLVAWRSGSYALARDFNISSRQLLYLIQEHHDWISLVSTGGAPLPGPDYQAQSFGLWNRLCRYQDPDKGTSLERAQTVGAQDQWTFTPDRWTSEGWVVQADTHVPTTAAVSRRLDVIVSDTMPGNPQPGRDRQMGKLWINSLRLKMYYWLPGSVQAWVELPLHVPGVGGGSGSTTPPTAVKAPLRRQIIQGSDTILMDLNILLPLGT